MTFVVSAVVQDVNSSRSPILQMSIYKRRCIADAEGLFIGLNLPRRPRRKPFWIHRDYPRHPWLSSLFKTASSKHMSPPTTFPAYGHLDVVGLGAQRRNPCTEGLYFKCLIPSSSKPPPPEPTSPLANVRVAQPCSSGSGNWASPHTTYDWTNHPQLVVAPGSLQD